MAVKNTKVQDYTMPFETVCAVLRRSDFSKLLDAQFIEEAITPDGREFRYQKKTTLMRYGRNYFVNVKMIGENHTSVAVTTQSRKVTVLIDTSWEKEVTGIFNIMDVLLSR